MRVGTLPAVVSSLASERSASWERAAVYAAFAYFAVAGAVEIFVAWHCPLEYTADLLYDDAYYYLGVAEHLARGAGSMFRAPLHTNGYQPLWLLALTGVAWLFSLGPRGLFVGAIALSVAIKLVAIASTRRLSLTLGLVVAFAWMPFVFSLGLETSLFALALPCMPWLLAPGMRSVPASWLSGIGFALLFLVRLDALAVFAVHATWRVVRERRIDRTLWLQAGIVALVAAVYFGLNWYWFGVPVPISGLAKQLGNVPGENHSAIWLYERGLAVCAVLALVHAIFRRRFRDHASDLDRVVAVLALSALITIVYYALGSGWRTWPWYNWPLALCFALSFARSLELAQRNLERGGRVLLAVLALLAVYLGLQGMGANKSDVLAALTAHHHARLSSLFPVIPSFNKDSVRLMARMFPADGPAKTIMMGDRAGGLGYWLPEQYRFIHSEGLVGDAAFLRARAAGQGEAFVDALHPDVMVVDRDRLLREGATYGVAEPIQGNSMHRGVMLFCFPEAAVVDAQALPLGYADWYTVRTRFTFDYHQRAECSPAMRAKLDALLAKPEALRDFSMSSEH